jgi:ABC-type multidrug transport system fused ATPase/permease subunit
VNIVFGQLVNQFTDYFRDPSNMPPGAFDHVLNQQSLYILALFLVRWALNSINKFCFQMIGTRLSSEVRRHYLESLLAQPIHAIDCMPPGGPATTITATSTTLQIGVSDRLGTFLQFLSTIVTAFIVSFIWSWDLTLVMMSLIVYALVVVSLAMPRIVSGDTSAAEADKQATSIATEALGGIRLVVACGAQARIMSSHQKWVDEARRRAQNAAPFLGIQFGLLVSLHAYHPTKAPTCLIGLLVLWCLRRIWPGILVWYTAIYCWRAERCRGRHCRSFQHYPRPQFPGTHCYSPNRCQQSHDCRLRVLHRDRHAKIRNWIGETR